MSENSESADPDVAHDDGDDEMLVLDELTTEQSEALQLSLGRIQSSANGVQFPKIVLPESTVPTLLAISGIAKTQLASMNAILKPITEMQSSWQKQLTSISGIAGINSDLFRVLSLVQPNLNLVATQLIQGLDFSALATASRIAENFAVGQATWLKNLAPAIASMRANFYPSNLRGIGGLKFEEVEQVVMADGIALYALPRTEIATALIRASGASGRREILGRRWKAISADCRTAVEGRGTSAFARYESMTLAALDALDAGHTEAAQALAGSLIDSILTAYLGSDRYKYTPNPNGTRTKDAYEEFNARQFIAFAPIWQAYQQFFVAKGDEVPRTFSRNATAHTVSGRQFNRRNAVQGLMVVCSLLCWLDEDAGRRKAG